MNEQNPHIIIGEEPGWGDPQPFGIASLGNSTRLRRFTGVSYASGWIQK